MRIDSHVHLITSKMLKQASAKFDKIKPGLMERVMTGGGKLVNNEFIDFLNRTSLKKFAEIWVSELKKHKIDHACFLPIGGGGALDQLDEFVSYNPDMFSAYVFLDNPTTKSGVSNFERRINSGRFRGIKLYPAIQGLCVADKKLFALYEKAAELDAPVLIHFGITMAPVTDYRYTNPLDLNLPSKLFPDTKFIIAHFGAGFFREVLLLGFHAENIYVDTSGTNNWRLFVPEITPLKTVFKRTMDVYGANRILFGTDSSINNKAGYRAFVLKEQKSALAKLKTPKKERELIMGQNAARIFHLNRA